MTVAAPRPFLSMTPAHPIEEHVPRLRRYARALVGMSGDPDDLVQDTVERALGRFHLWRPGSDLRAWLFTIMHNLHVNKVTSAAYQRTEALDEETVQIPVRATQTDRLEIRDLEAALARLPSEQREVVLLVGLEQMSYEEVANTLSIPIGTVMSRLSRGRERLRQLMLGLPAASTFKVVK